KCLNALTVVTVADPGKKVVHSAIVVVRKDVDILTLVHLKRFKLRPEYGVVLGHVKVLQRALQTVHRVYIDQTGVGEFFVEQAVREGVKKVQGVMLSLPEKENIMVYLKRTMERSEERRVGKE